MSEKLIRIYRIPGRRTGMGAITEVEKVIVLRGAIKVRRTEFSRSGNHWVEEIWASPDSEGLIFVRDISNSGKDYSYVIKISGGRVVEKVPKAAFLDTSH